MLRNTFIHLPGVGPRTEGALWAQGCTDWDCFLDSGRKYSVGSASQMVVREELGLSRKSLEERNFQYFRKRLRGIDAWRAYEEFKDNSVCLDIETEGGSEDDQVTCIGLYDGNEYVCLTKGDDIESFRDRISHYSMIITFFGAGFDLPVLERRFPRLFFDQIHVDLCPTLRSIGFRGGLKSIEKQFGIKRSPETDGLNGYDAIRLWRAARRGSTKAMELFVRYNMEDTVNLRKLADLSFRRLKRAVGAPESAPIPTLL